MVPGMDRNSLYFAPKFVLYITLLYKIKPTENNVLSFALCDTESGYVYQLGLDLTI